MSRRAVPLMLVGVAALAAGCGGAPRQDADEPRGTWRVDVEEASFPRTQRLAKPTELRMRVTNDDRRAIPNVAVTVEGFSRRTEQAGLSDPNEPLWILDRPPTGGATAYTNTWALGRVPAGGEREFVWKVTPVVPGVHRVRYRVSAGLDGKAKARTANGKLPQGTFRVRVSGEPADARVVPGTGRVERDRGRVDPDRPIGRGFQGGLPEDRREP